MKGFEVMPSEVNARSRMGHVALHDEPRMWLCLYDPRIVNCTFS